MSSHIDSESRALIQTDLWIASSNPACPVLTLVADHRILKEQFTTSYDGCGHPPRRARLKRKPLARFVKITKVQGRQLYLTNILGGPPKQKKLGCGTRQAEIQEISPFLS